MFLHQGKLIESHANHIVILDGSGELSGVQYKSQMINTLCLTK